MTGEGFTEIIQYIISFLVQDEKLVDLITYGKEKMNSNTRIVIIPEQYFWKEYGKVDTLPQIPLTNWRGIPILFGSDREEIRNGIVFIYADLIASSYYLISRYEELVNKGGRDEHGRYKAEASLPVRAGFIERPVVDEYGAALRSILSAMGFFNSNQKKDIQRIYLTHDVDACWARNTLTVGVKKSVKEFLYVRKFSLVPILNALGIYKWNRYDSFDFLEENDKKVQMAYPDRCEAILFLLGTKEETLRTRTYIFHKRFEKFRMRFLNSIFDIGLHESYEAGEDVSMIKLEKNNLEDSFGTNISIGRHHYLRNILFDELRELEKIGILKDFSMGYAERIGFRLGTSRCVRWIDPENRVLTNLMLQPLIIMDTTLYEEQYMGLNYNTSLIKCKEIINRIRDVGGDFCFLIHNVGINEGEQQWIKKLYKDVTDYLVEVS